MVVVSIIGTDKYAAGYGAAKLAHEQAALAGPIPARRRGEDRDGQ
jgi:hypothetical protein